MKTYTSFQELDALGEGLAKKYTGNTHRWNSSCFDIEGFITDFLKLPILYEAFAEDDPSKIGFLSDGITPLIVYRAGKKTPVVFPKDTIVIESFLQRSDESGRRRFTLAHEAAHFILNRHVPMQTACFHNAYEFARFMETADGKSRKENIARVPGGESGEPIIYMEVDSQTAKEWKRENNRACYLQKTMNALGIEVISYNVSPNAEDWEVNGEALLENPDCHVEDDVLRSILTENMLDAMCHLSEIEQKVITHLYLSDDPMTEHEFEKAFGVKRCTVHYYKGNALEKLREMLRENV